MTLSPSQILKLYAFAKAFRTAGQSMILSLSQAFPVLLSSWVRFPTIHTSSYYITSIYRNRLPGPRIYPAGAGYDTLNRL